MDHLTRLLMQARTARNGKGKHILGFIEYDINKRKFTAKCNVWDGVEGSGGENFCSEHDTQEEALAYCEALAAKYPNSENLNFIIDDMSFPEGV